MLTMCEITALQSTMPWAILRVSREDSFASRDMAVERLSPCNPPTIIDKTWRNTLLDMRFGNLEIMFVDCCCILAWNGISVENMSSTGASTIYCRPSDSP